MLSRIRGLTTKVKDLWQSADRGLKLRIGVGMLLGISLVTATILFTRPGYETLFADLMPADAGQITQRLQEMNIGYRLQDNGRRVLVPQAQVYELRNQLAMEGLPRGGTVGYEIFDQSKLGVTDFERRMQYIRALRGELSRTISQMEGVQSAAVEVALPEERLFVREATPPTASVVLDTIGQLDASQVRAIVHLVSHSVEGLAPENITVIDTSGHVLSDLIDPQVSPAGLSSSQLQLQRSVEKEIERNVQTMLEQVLGPGMVVTRVKADLNFDQREVSSEFFEPVVDEEGILRSMQELQRTFEGQAATQEAAGTASNIPPIYPGSAGGEGQYEETEVTKNYEISQIREHLVVAPGSVRHLSVSVLVNSDRDQEFSPAELTAIESAVAHAVGLRVEDRADQISVEQLPFALPKQEEVKPLFDRRIIYYASVILAAVVLMLFAFRRRRRRTIIDELTAAEIAVREAAVAEEDPEIIERQRIRNEIERLARQQPDEMAQLLTSWLSE
jgi:flagellar M-ring protein FliF